MAVTRIVIPLTGRGRIPLMRHGDVRLVGPDERQAGAVGDVPLAPHGVVSARAAGEVLAGSPIGTMITSGRPRTTETGRLVPEGRVGPPPPIDPAEPREIEGGPWAGIPDADLEIVRTVAANPSPTTEDRLVLSPSRR